MKPHHSPSDRDQQARQKLQQKVKIRSQAYIQLGEDTLKTVHRTFQPGVPVILHLPILSVFVPMVEKKIPKINTQSDQLSHSDTPDEEADLRLHTLEEERNYGMIRGSTQATQAALSHSRVQTNPTIERGPPQRPKIKKLPRDKAAERALRLRIRTNKCN